MIFNLKDMDMNNYVSWVYSELLKKVQATETDIMINGADIVKLYGMTGYYGQSMYTLQLASEQIPDGADLNEYNIAGTYYASGTAVATTMLNCPTTYNFKMTVEFITSSYVQQTILDRLGYRYVRCGSLSAGTWANWVGSNLSGISRIQLNNNAELVVTGSDGRIATYQPTSITG